MLRRHSLWFVVVAVMSVAGTATTVRAQPYPNQSIKIINPYAAGGGVEVMFRAFAQRMAGSDWPTIVTENRPGGTATIAAIATMQAKPDGYTLMAADTVSHALAVSMVKNLTYDPVKDFTLITLLYSFPAVLAVPADSPAKSVAELATLAKQKPGGLSYASQGNGTIGHVLGALFQKSVGVPMTHVPYRGAGPAMPDLVAGRVDFMFSTAGTMQPFVDSGKLRALANSSDRRMNDVAPMRDLGFPDVTYESWFALVGPAGLDPDVVLKLRERAHAALAAPDFVQLLQKAGMAPRPSTAQQLKDVIEADIKRLAPIVSETLAKNP